MCPFTGWPGNVWVDGLSLENPAVCYCRFVFGDHLHQWMQINEVRPILAALMGSALVGVGLLILFRHRASLGGFNIVCLWLQERYGVSAGKSPDGDGLHYRVVFCVHYFVVAPLLSVFAAVIVNVVLATNHKPGRYNSAVA